jgi:hypothetical protein
MAKETKKETRKETKKEFNKRAFASVFGGFSFIIMALTGLALFSAPTCRIARDTGWTIWGYSKEEMEALHVCFAIIFAIVAIYHIYLNWASIKRYFQGKASEAIGFRTEWVAALIVCVVIYAGTVRGAWPFSSLIDWHESYKHGAVGEAGHGQGWGGGRGATALRGGGAGRSESGSCDEHGLLQGGRRGQRALTKETGSSESGTRELQFQPQPLRGFGGGAGQAGGARGRGGQLQTQGPGRGMGRMTLSEFCSSEGMQLGMAIALFRDKGIAVQGTMTMRDIADRAGVHPSELRSILGLEGDCDHE